jgi:hypothetical protein
VGLWEAVWRRETGDGGVGQTGEWAHAQDDRLRRLGACTSGERAVVGRGQRRGAGPFLFYSFDYFLLFLFVFIHKKELEIK